MAKVYDALKRIEKERAQHTRATNAIPPRGQHLPAEGATAGMWKRWLSRKTREPAAPREISLAPDGVLLERIEHIAGRLDTFEEQTLKRIPGVQEQLHTLEQRFETLEKDTTRRIEELADQFAYRTLRLNTNVSILLGLIAFLLLLILIRV